MPSLPIPATDELKLADWLEILALISDDQNASLGDLERALRRSSVLEAGNDQRTQESIAQKCIQVISEIRDRAKSADAAYPFLLDGATLKVIGNKDGYVPYLFCLCLSFIGTSEAKSQRLFPRRLFEDLSCLAAEQYLGGESVRFASPRTAPMPRRFPDAVSVLCTRLREGERYRDQPSLSSKDATLDVVAWKHFPDCLPGKVVLFGQCASGADWGMKISALNPAAFCNYWMHVSPPSQMLRAFFLPHRVAPERWIKLTHDGGMIFDRCRMAFCSRRGIEPGLLKQMSMWTNGTLKDVRRLNHSGSALFNKTKRIRRARTR